MHWTIATHRNNPTALPQPVTVNQPNHLDHVATHQTEPTGTGRPAARGIAWTKTFTDPRLCAAIVDQLTFNGTIIETGIDSYRLAHTLAHQGTK